MSYEIICSGVDLSNIWGTKSGDLVRSRRGSFLMGFVWGKHHKLPSEVWDRASAANDFSAFWKTSFLMLQTR